MSELAAIGDLLEVLIDYRGKTPPKTKAGVPLITAKVIKGGRVLRGEQEYIAEDFYEAWMRRGLPRVGDILITTEAPLGEVAQIRGDPRVALAQRVILLRPDPRKVDPQFLFHFLRSPLAQERLRRRASGTTVSGIRQPELRAVEVSLLTRASQEKVGRILDDLDDLIENNRRRIEVLEQMVQAIYREWFVRFRYPGHEDATFVDSLLGAIPAGWEVRPLKGVASIVMGQSPPSEFYNDVGEGKPFHQGVTDFGAHFPTHRKFCTAEGRAAGEGAILVSVRAPVGRINLALDDIVIGRGLAAVNSSYSRQALLYRHLKHRVFAEEDSLGGGTIFKAITKRELEQVPVLCGPSELEALADRMFGDALELLRRLTYATRRLAEVRGLLLPRLVTGQLDVARLDLDEVVESVA